MPTETRFLYAVCQIGAENALKAELASHHPELKFAFSKSGFLTFKLDSNDVFPEKFTLRSTFARTYGWSLGKLEGCEGGQLAALAMKQFLAVAASSAHPKTPTPLKKINLHIWERDPYIPGQKGFEPGISVLAEEVGEVFRGYPTFPASSSPQEGPDLTSTGHQPPPTPQDSCAAEIDLTKSAVDSDSPGLDNLQIRVNYPVPPDSLVFDVVLVEPNQWWIGYHYAVTPAGRWPGGVPDIDPETPPVSRAYFKAAEALAWSGIHIRPGQWCAEIGSAPGGCCQLLLEKGAKVIGIDPADMDPLITQHPNFVHFRMRGNEVKKKELASVKWLFADINLVPNYTLDTIAEIVQNQQVHVQGLVLTMKLADWSLADHIPAFRNKIGGLGFKVIKTRQLAFNRREFCLVAVKDKFVLRKNRQKFAKKPLGKSKSSAQDADPK